MQYIARPWLAETPLTVVCVAVQLLIRAATQRCYHKWYRIVLVIILRSSGYPALKLPRRSQNPSRWLARRHLRSRGRHWCVAC